MHEEVSGAEPEGESDNSRASGTGVARNERGYVASVWHPSRPTAEFGKHESGRPLARGNGASATLIFSRGFSDDILLLMISGWSRSSKQSHETTPHRYEQERGGTLCIHPLTVFLATPSHLHPHPLDISFMHIASTSVCLRQATFLYSLCKKKRLPAAPYARPQVFIYSATILIYDRPLLPPVSLRLILLRNVSHRPFVIYMSFFPRSQVSAQGRL